MTDPTLAAHLFEFDAFRASVGATFVFAALSVMVPMLTAPTAALAALGLASWASRARRRSSLASTQLSLAAVLALAALGVAAVGFLDLPPFLSRIRGPVLAAGLVPLLLIERVHSAHRVPVFRSG